MEVLLYGSVKLKNEATLYQLIETFLRTDINN